MGSSASVASSNKRSTPACTQLPANVRQPYLDPKTDEPLVAVRISQANGHHSRVKWTSRPNHVPLCAVFTSCSSISVWVPTFELHQRKHTEWHRLRRPPSWNIALLSQISSLRRLRATFNLFAVCLIPSTLPPHHILGNGVLAWVLTRRGNDAGCHDCVLTFVFGNPSRSSLARNKSFAAIRRDL